MRRKPLACALHESKILLISADLYSEAFLPPSFTTPKTDLKLKEKQLLKVLVF